MFYLNISVHFNRIPLFVFVYAFDIRYTCIVYLCSFIVYDYAFDIRYTCII